MEEAEVTDESNEFCDKISFSLTDAYCDENLIYVKVKNEKDTDFKDSFTIVADTLEGEKEITTFLVNTELLAYEEKELKAAIDAVLK